MVSRAKCGECGRVVTLVHTTKTRPDGRLHKHTNKETGRSCFNGTFIPKGGTTIMALKIEPATVEELESEFGTSSNGNDPETVVYIRGLAIGQGFNVTAEGGETARQVKRRINACAKEGFRELDWRDRPNGGLAARVKAIEVEEEKKWLAAQEEEAKKAAEIEAQKAAQIPPASEDTPPPVVEPNGQKTPPEDENKGSRKREPATT